MRQEYAMNPARLLRAKIRKIKWQTRQYQLGSIGALLKIAFVWPPYQAHRVWVWIVTGE
jgi:hypothetical protein